MRTFAILPIKEFSAAKSRLAQRLAPADRRLLARSMCTDVMNALRDSPSIDATFVVTRDEQAAAIAVRQGATVIGDHSDSHSSAALQGIVAATAAGAERVLLIAGDCPLLRADDIETVLATETTGARSTVIVPDREGLGTNALILTPPDASAPSFGPGSRARHRELALAAGASATDRELPAFALDTDTPEDLSAVAVALRGSTGNGHNTRVALSQLASRYPDLELAPGSGEEVDLSLDADLELDEPAA